MLQLRAKEPFFQVCRSQPRTKQHHNVCSITHDTCETAEDLFIGMIRCAATYTPEWKVSILVNQQRSPFKIDTGAQCNVSLYRHLSSVPLQKLHA